MGSQRLSEQAAERLAAARARGVSRQRLHQLRYPERHSARQAVADALQRGTLMRPASCSRCPAVGPTEAHHADYSRPLEVVWLCRRCHRLLDKAIRASKPRPPTKRESGAKTVFRIDPDVAGKLAAIAAATGLSKTAVIEAAVAAAYARAGLGVVADGSRADG